MDDVEVEEISFEYRNGKWFRIEEDPEDDEEEIIYPIRLEHVYTQMKKLKAKGWKQVPTKDHPDFDGYILFKKVDRK